MDWSSLAVNDGHDSSSGVLLMTGGLCLDQGAESSDASFQTIATGRKGGHGSALPPQRVQAKSDADRAAEAAPGPIVTRVRVVVTGTNGIADARINEIRLYDADGVKPFPKQVQN